MKNHKKKKVRNKPTVNRGIRVSNQTSEEQLEKIGLEAEQIYQMFIDNMSKDLDDPAVYACVVAWQEYLTKYYYKCTDMILARLANLYVTDKLFTESLDQFQIGLAGFMSQAIKAYLRRDLPKLVKAEPVKEEVKAPVEEAPVEKKTRAPRKTAAKKNAEEGEAKPKKTTAKKSTAKKDGETKAAKTETAKTAKSTAKKSTKKADEEKPAKKPAAKKTTKKKADAE